MKCLLLSRLAGLAQAYTVTTVELFMLKNIDPILFPSKYTSHMHSFFGSDAVAINTTTSVELQIGCSSTQNPNGFSAYCMSCICPPWSRLPAWGHTNKRVLPNGCELLKE